MTRNAELHDICGRIARLEQERKDLAAEVAEIKKDAKDSGFDAALITRTVRIMLLNSTKRTEALIQHDLFDTYLNAAGLIDHDPATGEVSTTVSAAA